MVEADSEAKKGETWVVPSVHMDVDSLFMSDFDRQGLVDVDQDPSV
jgi:hypothetical protein